MRSLVLAIITAALLCPLPAQAQDDTDEERPPLREMTDEQLIKHGFEGVSLLSREGSWESGLIALGPGTIVHGLGHFAVGDKATGWDLFIAETFGLGLVAGGALTLALSDDSQLSQGIGVGLAQIGGVLFAASWLADVIGVFRGSENPLPEPLLYDNLLNASAGYRFLNSDDVGFFNLIEATLEVELGPVSLRPYVLLDVQLGYQQFGLSVESRVLPGRGANDYIGLEAGVERANFGDDLSTDLLGLQTSVGGAITRGHVGLVISSDLSAFAEHLEYAVNALQIGVGFAGDAGFRAALPGDRQIAHLILRESLRVNITRQIHVEPYYVFSEAEMLTPSITLRIRRSRIPILGLFGTRFAIAPTEGFEIYIDGAIAGGFSLSTGLRYHLF